MSKLSHIDKDGRAQMVDVTDKDITQRTATAQSRITMQPETLQMILEGGHKKGDVFTVARIAGIQAAKRTSDLIPMCHPLMLTSINIDLIPDKEDSSVLVEVTCKLADRTGVEMEALTAASVTALTIYDMCKAVDKGMVIGPVQLVEKAGGRSGHWRAE